MKAVDAALAYWRASGVPLQPGIAEPTVLANLDAVSRHASSDVVSLFAAVNGMDAGESDGRTFSLWSLDHSVAEASYFDETFLPFADFLVESCVFLLKRESATLSSVWIQYGRSDVPRQVAASVDEFFDFLVNSPERVEVVL